MIKKFFYFPTRIIGLQLGAGVVFFLIGATVTAMIVSGLVLDGRSRLVSQALLSALTVYGLFGYRQHVREVEDSFLVRCAAINNNHLVPTDDEIASQAVFKRPLIRATIKYGEKILSLRQSSETHANDVGLHAQIVANDAVGLSGRAEEIATMLEQTAAGMEQFAATIERSAASCKDAHQQSAAVLALAESGVSSVHELAKKMEGSRQFVTEISQLVLAIDDIAIQINILALNASIEAARAGEQGRAFAVVASEVRKLSVRTSGSTKKVTEVLAETLKTTDAGKWLADDAIDGIAAVVTQTRSYVALIKDIATCASEQSAGVSQIKIAVEHMASLTQQNTVGVDELAAAAAQISSQASAFKQTLSTIHKLDINTATI